MDICRLTSDQPDSIKMVEIDFQALCRICGALGESLTSVFGKRAADRLRERVEKHFQIEILPDDCFPTKICDGCRETLDQFHELFEKCHRTEEKFRAMASATDEGKEAEQEATEVPDGPPSGDDIEEEELEVVKNTSKELSRSKQETVEGATERISKRLTRSCSQAFTCSFCKTNGTIKTNTFINKEGLVEHLKDQHSEQIFHCEQCDNYLDRNVLIQHMTMHALSLFGQSSPNESQQEDEDDQEQQTSGVDVEEGEGSQQTAEGKSGEGTEIAANKENDDETSPPPQEVRNDARKLYCYICEKTLANRSAYSYHINQVHLNIKNFTCTYCSKKFGNQRLLNNHVAGVHSRERNFTCTTCSKRFKTNVALYNHQRIHDDSTIKFSCSFCDKKFRYRNHLTSHQLVHMNERNFPCTQCDKKFNNPECLQKHKLTHVETLPYQCPLCGFSTKQKRYLIMHAKRTHMVR
ncbi:gastrula zinc finger protein XlCGF57.1-like [Toxorhynchites rutilus septentrionalis]|uniref:gastrula zinc finger protein XlCGF57.1-like n=1 Tax=Toxorhynchites rutilus septentrionalis TaxID=329112 RepID=UPI002478D694|nr:gastrula zinc finger protein XlCGF57.1-like [Toxorhynchites rutilus septentrionalis]